MTILRSIIDRASPAKPTEYPRRPLMIMSLIDGCIRDVVVVVLFKYDLEIDDAIDGR